MCLPTKRKEGTSHETHLLVSSQSLWSYISPGLGMAHVEMTLPHSVESTKAWGHLQHSNPTKNLVGKKVASCGYLIVRYNQPNYFPQSNISPPFLAQKSGTRFPKNFGIFPRECVISLSKYGQFLIFLQKFLGEKGRERGYTHWLTIFWHIVVTRLLFTTFNPGFTGVPGRSFPHLSFRSLGAGLSNSFKKLLQELLCCREWLKFRSSDVAEDW